MNEFVTYVKRYHTSHRKPYTYFGAPRENFKGAGIELEFDSINPQLDRAKFRDNCAKILAERPDTDHYFIERDSSLVAGFEIVTQPHTIPELKKFLTNFSTVFPLLIAQGAENECDKAALHIHVSRRSFGATTEEQNRNIAKVLHFVAMNKEDWIKSGRRKETKKSAVKEEFVDKEAALKYVTDCDLVRSIERRNIERYVAINLRNKTTVEFRTMQTTFDLEVLLAEIDFVMLLVNTSNTIGWEECSDTKQWFVDVPDNVRKYLKSVNAFVQYL